MCAQAHGREDRMWAGDFGQGGAKVIIVKALESNHLVSNPASATY